MLAKIVPYWTVDLTTTDHIARDRNAFVDFRRIPKGSKTIYMGNNTSTGVLGIGTYKLVMRKGRTVTPQSRGFVDYPSTRGIQVGVGLPDATSENRAESPLYGELYPNKSPA